MATAFTDSVGGTGFDTVSGTSAEVRHKLEMLDPEQVVAFMVEHGDAKFARLIADTMVSIAPFIVATLARREKDALEQIVELLVPQVPPPRHLLMEARMNAEARKAVLESADWLTAAEVAEVAGFSAQNPSTQPNKWKKEGRIFAVRRNGVDYYPGYALDPDAAYRPLKALAPILETFAGRKDEWSIAIWFASVNSFLGGRIPKDLLASDPDQIQAAAEDEMAGVVHG